MRKKDTELPVQIYVVRESDVDSSYLTASENIADIEHGALVGVYELVRVRTLNVTRTLEE